MQRNIAFNLGGKFSFVPNQNFWTLALGALVAVALLAWGELKEYWAWQALLQAGEAAVAQSDREVSSLSIPFVAGLSAMLSILARLLVNYLIKANRILLLYAGAALHPQQMSFRVGTRTLSMAWGKLPFYLLLLSFFIVSSGFYYLRSSNESLQAEVHRKISQHSLPTSPVPAPIATGQDELLASESYKQDAIGSFMDYFQQYQEQAEASMKNYQDAFLMQKQMAITQYLIQEKVSRIDQLSNKSLLALNKRISDLFVEIILGKQPIEAHVYRFFTDTADLDKLETALMEQAKFHVPASIKLAQAALETGYGSRVVHKNYFGIKDKSGRAKPIETIEYYNEKEAAYNASKIVWKKKVVKDGKELYKCRIRDSFAQYGTAWESFRAHSLFLKENPRYHALFVEGKDYEAWADKIGSTKYGGVGYATSPVYGELLKKIVKRYHLHLLDL